MDENHGRSSSVQDSNCEDGFSFESQLVEVRRLEFSPGLRRLTENSSAPLFLSVLPLLEEGFSIRFESGLFREPNLSQYEIPSQ
jgi:hypothetical protein